MDLAATFDGLTLAKVEDFISQNQEEHLNLDFKTINNSDLSHSDDKKNLAKSLSGFANSSGGIIVWGIDARKNSDGVDCASARKEIDRLALFVSRLNELTGNATSPIVDGVRHKAIPIGGDRGFALTLVPGSDSGPHMAKFSEDRYYKRSGDSFYRMEHFDIEDMFGRRAKPELVMEIKARRCHGDEQVFVLSLMNSGRGTAKAPYLKLKLPPGCNRNRYGVDGNCNEGLPQRVSQDASALIFGGSADTIIHPGTSHDICAIEFDFKRKAQCSTEIEYELAAEGVRLTLKRAAIP